MVKLFFYSGLAFVIAFMARMRSAPAPNAIDRQAAADLYQYRLLNSADCSADFGGPFDDNLSIPLLDGWGNHMMNITTRSDSAFLYFNQGMNMFYGFHFIEARASFKKAQNFDSTSAMTFLAEALTYGPSINNPAYKLRPYVVTLIEKAK